MLARVAAALDSVKAKSGRRDAAETPVIGYLWGVAESESLEPQTPYDEVLQLLARAAIEEVMLCGLHLVATPRDDAGGEEVRIDLLGDIRADLDEGTKH